MQSAYGFRLMTQRVCDEQVWMDYKLFIDAPTDAGLRDAFKASCERFGPLNWLSQQATSMTADGALTTY